MTPTDHDQATISAYRMTVDHADRVNALAAELDAAPTPDARAQVAIDYRRQVLTTEVARFLQATPTVPTWSIWWFALQVVGNGGPTRRQTGWAIGVAVAAVVWSTLQMVI